MRFDRLISLAKARTFHIYLALCVMCMGICYWKRIKKGHDCKCISARKHSLGRSPKQLDCVCVGLWKLCCSPPQRYRAMLCTIGLCCAECSFVPMKWCTRRALAFTRDRHRGGAQGSLVGLRTGCVCSAGYACVHWCSYICTCACVLGVWGWVVMVKGFFWPVV